MIIEPAILAYIDPASGSIVFQVVIAALLSAGVMFRHALLAPLAFLRQKRPAGTNETPVAEADPSRRP